MDNKQKKKEQSAAKTKTAAAPQMGWGKISVIFLIGIVIGLLLLAVMWVFYSAVLLSVIPPLSRSSDGSTSVWPPLSVLLLLFYIGYIFSILSAMFQKGVVQFWYRKLPVRKSILVSFICGIGTLLAGGYIFLIVFFFKSFLFGIR